LTVGSNTIIRFSKQLNSTVDFANDWTVKAVTTLTTTAAGTYAVSSELDVFLKLNFGSSSLVY
jgi:hypothetical protein